MFKTESVRKTIVAHGNKGGEKTPGEETDQGCKTPDKGSKAVTGQQMEAGEGNVRNEDSVVVEDVP